MADLIKCGRRCHATGKYKRALTFFTKAMRSCPCSSGTKLDKCTCRNFEKIASQGGSIFKEAVEICPCNVGILFKKCDNPHHIQALDFRAATYEALGKLDQAIKDAEWILELAPRLPDGYLCLGRIARQQKKDEYAWKIYTAGIEASRESAVGSSPKLQELSRAREPLYRRFFTRDPLSLPSELVTQIFSELEYKQLFPCLRVCKEWTRTLTSPLHGQLWRDIIYPTLPNSCPRFDQLKRAVSWAGSGGARSILMLHRSLTPLTSSELTLLLKLSPNLQFFSAWPLPQGCSLPLDVKQWTRLKRVMIQGHNYEFHRVPVDHPGGFPKTFLQNAANSLEHLKFEGIPRQWFNGMTSIPRLHNLKSLEIDHYDRRDYGSSIPFRIFYLCDAFPRLERLHIGRNLPFLDPEPVADWPKWWERLWPHLKVLKFDTWSFGNGPRADDLGDRTRSTLRYLTCLNRGNSLQHIQFRISSPSRNGRCITSDDHDLLPGFDVGQFSEFQNLEYFSLREASIPPDRARNFLYNAVQAKKLTSLDIVFPGESRPADERVVEENIRHLQGYKWLCGAPSIHTLGCYNFRFGLDVEHGEDLSLPRFLASFPSLRTLVICSIRYGLERDRSHEQKVALESLVVAIIRATHLRTIHAVGFGGMIEQQPQLMQVARDHDVELTEDSRTDQWSDDF